MLLNRPERFTSIHFEPGQIVFSRWETDPRYIGSTHSVTSRWYFRTWADALRSRKPWTQSGPITVDSTDYFKMSEYSARVI